VRNASILTEASAAGKREHGAMDPIDTYLQAHYLSAPRFAAACAISTCTLSALVDDGLVPRSAYVVTVNGTLLSAAFGEMPAPAAMPGEYHHPGHVAWVAIALQLQRTPDARDARALLGKRFRSRFAAALAGLDRRLHRLTDSFDDGGNPVREGLARRTASAWKNFIGGVYGVCVVDPSNVASIARKEVLQEALTDATANGSRTHFPDDAALHVSQLVEKYAAATMPFAPPEYPRSSRKRLVDDLRTRLPAP
jgi:uncharacterized protein DUF6058